MRRGALVVGVGFLVAAAWWLFAMRDSPDRSASSAPPSPPQQQVVAPDIQEESNARGAGHLRFPQVRAIAPIPPERMSDSVLSTEQLSEQDPAAFSLVMHGLKGIRPAIRQCVFDLENTVQRPTVFEWPMILEVATDGDTRTVRVVEASADAWPDELPAELRECFSVAFAGVEFDSGDERFAYKLTYPMAVSVAPPPSR